MLQKRIRIGIVIFLFLIITGFEGKPQAVVSAPMLESLTMNQSGILGSMGATMAAIEKAERKVEAMKKMAGWIVRLESMQEFVQLLETTTCMAKDLDVNLNIALGLIGSRASCLNEFKYKVNINRLRYVVDVINLVLTNGFSMSREGRMESYRDALDTFQRAQVGLEDLAVDLERIINRYERAKRYKEELFVVNDFGRYR